jgi:crotonobetainyl-CoA:carnitine CoA-transferase CaiB-like acyl-CoA transferase
MAEQGFRPLQGVRVLEVAQNLAGPYAGQILHDLGAEVVKVEPPEGDPARRWGPPFVAGEGAIFVIANRGKRALSLDLRADADRARLRSLIEQSDVLIEALRPEAFRRLGFGWETVREWTPRLVYCSVLAYGETGPLRELAGYDPLMQAHGGIMSVTGDVAGEPARVGTSLIDMGTGMWLAIGILAALRQRDSTGAGTRLSVSLYDTALAWNAYHLAGHAASGFVPHRMGSELPMIAPYGTFPTRDGRLMIAPANDRLFRRLCAALGAESLAADGRFSNNAARVAHRAELGPLLEARTAAFTTTQLLETLRAAGVPCAPVQDITGVAADPQTRAAEMMHGSGDGVRFSLPLRVAGQRLPADGTVPPLSAR